MTLLPIFILMFTAQPPPSQPVQPACAVHPLVNPSDVAQRTKERRQRARDNQARPDGREVGGSASDPGGGDCDPPNMPRGHAAAAVGALLYDGEPRCSAVLITRTMIITAAHCVAGMDFAKMEFVLGENAERPIQRAGVTPGLIFREYDGGRLGVHDIAYAYLKKRITEATPLGIPDETWRDSANLSLMHVGYGIAGVEVGARRCVDIPVKDFCDYTFSHQTPNLNTCHGDSGGGIFRDRGDRLQLVGLTGWGDDACKTFGVNTDVGRYGEWIAAKMHYAPRNVPLAPVEHHARKKSSVKPDRFFADMSDPRGEKLFENKYKGRFVTWEAQITSIRNNSEIPDVCDLEVTAGREQNIWLFEYPDGCDLKPGGLVHFTGRLAGLNFRSVDIVQAEPVQRVTPTQPPPPLPPVGSYTLARVTPRVNEIRQPQTQDLRLESGRGSWSGRVRECRQVNIVGPARLDRNTKIVFKPAYQNHGGYDEAQNLADQSFCIPMWAEGFGGIQTFGTTLDAGQIGVVSGTVSYGIVRTESTTAMEVVRTGDIPGEPEGVTIDLPTDGQYLVTIRLLDGSEQTVRESGTYGAIEAARADRSINLRPRSNK